MDKKRIGVFLNCPSDLGGQYQYCFSALDALATLPKEKYEIIAIYTYDCWESICANYGFTLHKVQCKTAGLYENIHKLCCDILLYLVEGFNITEIIPDIPLIVAVHDLCFHYDKENSWIKSELGYHTYKDIYGKLTNRAMGILVDSEYGKKQLIELYGTHCADKVYVMPFVPPKYLYEPVEQKVSDISQKLPDKYIFYPANFFPHKNHSNLVIAAKRLKDKGIIINLVFTGKENEYSKNIHSLVEANGMLDQVIFTGRIPDNDMRYAYEHARAMVMPTLEGPTNIPPLEAMLLGCPVAVSRVGAMPEQVGRDGLTFDPFDVDDIASVLKRLWLDDELCDNLIQNGFEQMKNNTLEEFNNRFVVAVQKTLETVEARTKILNDLLEQIRGYKIICYGLGDYGYWVYKYLSSIGVKVEAFFDQAPENNDFYDGKVFRMEDWQQETEGYVVLLTLRNMNTNMLVKEKLKNVGFTHTCVVTWQMIITILQHFDCLVHYPRG